MAPWPQRLNANSSTSNGPTTSAQPNPNKPLPPSPPRAADYEIPILRRKPLQRTPDPAPLNHSRSFSHPFPSLFGGGRKSEKKNHLKTDANIYDTTDDDASINGDSARPNFSGKAPSRNTSQKGNKEPVTGKCMTCDSGSFSKHIAERQQGTCDREVHDMRLHSALASGFESLP